MSNPYFTSSVESNKTILRYISAGTSHRRARLAFHPQPRVIKVHVHNTCSDLHLPLGRLHLTQGQIARIRVQYQMTKHTFICYLFPCGRNYRFRFGCSYDQPRHLTLLLGLFFKTYATPHRRSFLVVIRFQALFTLYHECFSTFPHGTNTLSDLCPYLGLDLSRPIFARPNQVMLLFASNLHIHPVYEAFTLCRPAFQQSSTR